MNGIRDFIKRQLSLDNIVGQLVWVGLGQVVLVVVGLVLDLPPLSVAALALGGGYLALAWVLAWREGWRPGTFRGTRGWKVRVVAIEGQPLPLLIELYPPPNEPFRELMATVIDPRREEQRESSGTIGVPGRVRPPSATVVDGTPNPNYFMIYPAGLLAQLPSLDDGRYQVRWSMRTNLGWQPLASKWFRVKRGHLL